MKKPEKIEILHDSRKITYIQGDNENDYKIGRVADIEKQMSYTYDHYVIAQDKNTEFNDIIILKNGKEVFHASCDKQFSDEELKKYIIDYIQFQKQKEFKGE